MKFFLPAFIFLSIYFNAASQNTFQKVYGGFHAEWAYSIHPTYDSGYIFSGKSYSSPFGYNDFLVKIDQMGDTLWTRTYLDSTYLLGCFVQQTLDTGYILTGTAMAPSNESFIYLLKTNSFGDTLWTKTFTGGYPYAVSVIQTSDSCYITIGIFSNPNDDIFIIKSNLNGDTLWTKAYGGSGEEWVKSVQETSDHGLIIFGHTNSFGFPYDYYLIKTDSLGNIEWSKTYGSNINDSYGRSAIVTSDGGYAMTGSAGAIKTDESGNVEWSSTYDIGMFSGYTQALIQSYDHGFLFTGNLNVSAYTQVFILKTDSSGSPQWCNSFDQDEFFNVAGAPNAFAQALDSGYIITGYRLNEDLDSNGLYIVKTDINGNSSCNQSSVIVNPYIWNVQDTNVSINIYPVSFTMGTLQTEIGYLDSVLTLCEQTNLIDEKINTRSYFSISPNPAEDYFSISNLSNSLKEIQIYNPWGQIVFSSNVNPNTGSITITCDHFPKGIYFVKATSNSVTGVKKIVIQ